MVITAPINVIENNEQQQYQYNSAHPSHRQQSQIVANIENNSLSYELDDDISYSQISFKHNLRHDEGTSSRGSLHNVYDNTSVSTTNTSATTKNLAIGGDNDSNFHRVIPGLEEVKEHDDDDRRMKIRYNDKIGTSIFVENDDILNDKNYPKITHRHSTLLLPTSINSVCNDGDLFCDDDRYQKKRRRYSDTKLLNSCEFENEFLIDNKNINKYDRSHHVFGSPTTKTKEPNEANMNDLIFEKSDDFDPMELNIQNILEIDLRSNRKTSADNQQTDGQQATNNSTSDNNSRSLPNLDGV